jgi:hypothetical protein
MYKVREILGVYNDYDDFECNAYFYDGSVLTYTGRPWGPAFEEFKSLASSDAVAIEMNMTGSFWRFS